LLGFGGRESRLKAGSCIRNEKLGLRYGKDVD
jgi:hypothetical protein